MSYDTSDTETQLFVDNTEPLYRMKMAIWTNYARKCRKGVFDPALAKKGFRNLTDYAAQLYKKETGSALSVTDRRTAEKDFVDEFVRNSGCRKNRPMGSERLQKFVSEYGIDPVKHGGRPLKGLRRHTSCGCGR